MIARWLKFRTQKEAPDDLGPAILVGAILAAILFSIVIVAYGQPVASTSMQTGSDDAEASNPLNELIAGKSNSVAATAGSSQTVAEIDAHFFASMPTRLRYWNTSTQSNKPEKSMVQTVTAAVRFGSEHDKAHAIANTLVGASCSGCHDVQAMQPDGGPAVSADMRQTDDLLILQRAGLVSPALSFRSESVKHYLAMLEPPALDNRDTRMARDHNSDTGINPFTTELASEYLPNSHAENSVQAACAFCHDSNGFRNADDELTVHEPDASRVGLTRQLAHSERFDFIRRMTPAAHDRPFYQDAPPAVCQTCHTGDRLPEERVNITVGWPKFASLEVLEYE